MQGHGHQQEEGLLPSNVMVQVLDLVKTFKYMGVNILTISHGILTSISFAAKLAEHWDYCTDFSMATATLPHS